MDASGLVKWYAPEPESDVLDAYLFGRSDLVTSELAVTELVSALCRHRRESRLSPLELDRLIQRIRRQMRSDLFRFVDLTPAVHRNAERRLLDTQGIELRAGDALHLALALDAGCATMVTYDRRLAEASRRHGMMVFPS